jgi:hypothetical protein
MYCDICVSHDHVRLRCPKFQAVKPAAIPCGYVVEGLGFFHVPFEFSHKQRSESRFALIRVMDGHLSSHHVVSELERLIPGPWTWIVEESGDNTFRMVFPSKAELLRMVEWGVVHTKFQQAKIKIEERMVDNEVKFVLPKVLIQFTGLPPHLRDYLILWAVRSIMGVRKDMDMEFTRQQNISRVHVMVMNPNLIPNSVNIVIGDGLYEAQVSGGDEHGGR